MANNGRQNPMQKSVPIHLVRVELQDIEVKPGMKFVVTVPQTLSVEQMRAVRDKLAQFLEVQIKQIVVLPQGISLAAAHQETTNDGDQATASGSPEGGQAAADRSDGESPPGSVGG